MQIADNTFMVTGGGSGLGAATAQRLISHGANVVIADIKEPAQAARTLFVRTDVTDPGQCKAAVDAALKTFRGLHGVISCAGIVVGEKILGKDGPHRLESFARCIQVNLVGVFNMVRLAADAMSRQEPNSAGERGVIISTASVAAFDGQIGQAAYAASKGGLVSMTLPMARELARFGIRVMTIAPGIFETPMMSMLPEGVRESLGQSVPFPPRLGRPDEFAALCQHIVENEMLNGEVIRLDGAIRMTAK